MAYRIEDELQIKPKPSMSSFRLRDGTHKSLCVLRNRMPTRNVSDIHLGVDVVRPDVALLIGLGIIDQEQLVANDVENRIENIIYNWTIPSNEKWVTCT